ncbi:MAG: hypothetical protein Nk1A_8840 [Endomicrobiia bacterium]|nr:MAG: hypothetical protein Nk1A_8840 [Endomicrobiia bacterium]
MSDESVKDLAKDLEFKPSGNYVLVKPYVDNPYEQAVVRESGIELRSGPASFKNPDSGDEDEQQAAILVGNVIEVGPECKWVQPGDDIYYHFGSTVPIPFFRQGLQVLGEPRVFLIVNKDLNGRFQKL